MVHCLNADEDGGRGDDLGMCMRCNAGYFPVQSNVLSGPRNRIGCLIHAFMYTRSFARLHLECSSYGYLMHKVYRPL